MFSNNPIPNPPPLVIKSYYTYELIKRVNDIKFLGVYYDHKLTFKPHINHLTQRLSRTCALIYRVKDLMPTFVLKNLFHAHVGSIISYCNIVWANTYPTNLQPLILIMKRIIRNVAKSDFLAHTVPIFKQLQILDFESTRKLSLAIYLHKTQNINIPPMLANHDYLTRHRHRLRPPQHRLTLFQNSFMYQAPIFWNTICTAYPPHIKNSPSLNSFKSRLKKHLLHIMI